MIENSSAGLVMLESEVTVTVTREDEHQRLLARYSVAVGKQRHVAVELGWCTIGSGKYRGQPAVEVRLDGHRVGELTYAMSRRYTPALTQVTSRGGRPGCEAIIQPGAKGLEIVLRLPRHLAGVVALPGGHAPSGPVVRPRPTASGPWSGPTGPQRPSWQPPAAVPPAPPTVPPATRSAAQPGQPSRPAQRVASHRPWWIAAAVVAVLFIAAVAANDDEPSSTNTAADSVTTTTVAPATTTTTTTVAPTTTTEAPIATTPAPEPAPVAQPPVPPRATPKPAPPPPPAPAEPEPQCDPNYSGCVPVASDVDCKGGSGNGPAYVAGPIRVIGSDIYGLDNDNDGVACE